MKYALDCKDSFENSFIFWFIRYIKFKLSLLSNKELLKIIYELESIRSDIGDIPKQEIVDILKEILNEFKGGVSVTTSVPKENIQVTFVSKI